MRNDRRIRLLLAAVVLVALVLFAGALLAVADTVLSIVQRLRDGPAGLYFGFLFLLSAGAAAGAWLLWWLLAPPRRRRRTEKQDGKVLDETSLRAQLEREQAAGTDTAAAERELAELARRRSAGRLHIAMFGEASAGKSSLVRSLVPGASPDTAVTGGTTRAVMHYQWTMSSGDVVEVADVPGRGDERELGESALEEAARAHLVIFVCEGDLSRSQFDDVETLAAIGKPMVVAINKADWYSGEDMQRIVARLAERLGHLAPPPAVVPVVAGGTERVIAEHDGREVEQERPRAPQVDALRQALQARLESDPEALEALRDSSVFRLAAARLETAAGLRRREAADKLVSDYTRKAIIGAMAAFTPGTDILIQGYLGTSLVKELCRLYDVPAREIDIQRFLDIAQGYVGRALPLLLAISGNVLKAFPGAGTVAGGLVHAVAYGIIFDAMGKGLVNSLETSGDLRPAAAARNMGDEFGKDIGKRARQLARVALEASRASRD